MLTIEEGHEANGRIVCRVVGESYLSTVTQLRDSLAHLATCPRLVIDLSAVPFVDSAGRAPSWEGSAGYVSMEATSS